MKISYSVWAYDNCVTFVISKIEMLRKNSVLVINFLCDFFSKQFSFNHYLVIYVST